jgi:hypothetical protein
MGFWDWFLGRKSERREKMQAHDEDLNVLEEEDFWAIIEESLEFKDNQEDQLRFLEEKVEGLSPREIAGFEVITNMLLLKAYRSDLWCAAYVIQGGCGDDGFDYFRSWLISRGRNVFERALRNPDSLTDYIDDVSEFEFEEFDSIARGAFHLKTGMEIDDYARVNKIKLYDSKRPELVFEWTEEDENSIREICPRLFERFWGKYDGSLT